MTLQFDEIDKLLIELPKEINKMIYLYYDTKCNNCGDEMIGCKICGDFFCKIHICFGHQTSSCSICTEFSCPYKTFDSPKICECINNELCENCYFLEERERINNIITDNMNTIDSLYVSPTILITPQNASGEESENDSLETEIEN